MDRATILVRQIIPENVAGQTAQPTAQPLVLHESHQNGLLSITLNRPQALNALTKEMIGSIFSVFKKHLAEGKTRAIVISSSGNAFCAGGDIRYLAELVKKADIAAFSSYLTNEYQCDRMVYTLPVPYVALIDGIWMGGGVGISYGAKFKVVTEKALFAMPETGIGFLPDVSGSYFLPRLPGSIGMYLGLLGARIKAADCLHVGIATHFVPTAKMSALKTALQTSTLSDAASVEAVIRQFSTAPPETPPLLPNIAAINRCFSADSVEEIIARLQKEDSVWAAETLRVLGTRSPTALKVTFATFRKGGRMSLEDALNMEHQVCVHFAQHPDFAEGVRAVIFDKDNKPRWQPPTLQQVSAADVAKFFTQIAPPIKFPSLS